MAYPAPPVPEAAYTMMEFWPHFLRPAWLLALPVVVGWLWYGQQRRQNTGYWHQVLPPQFHSLLLTQGRQQSTQWLNPVLALGWLLAVLALAGPSWQQNTQSPPVAEPLVVVLEMTPDLYATDTPPNRLQQARHKLLDLLRLRQGAQTGVVVFAGSAHTLVPLSTDLATTQNLLDALTPALMPTPGRRADLGVAQALKLLDQAGQGRGRLLLLTTRLEGRERNAIRLLLMKRPETLSILGLGTPQGGPIVEQDGRFQLNAQGQIQVARLDELPLRDFAIEYRGHYHRLSLDDSDLQALEPLANPEEAQTTSHSLQPTWQDQGHWLLPPLLLLVALGARRGWLFCVPLLWLVPLPSPAAEWSDLWQRPDQQAWQLLQQQQPEAAAQRFQDSQWQGVAYYQAGDYAAAAACFARSTTAIAHYNRGNALALAGQLPAALQAYEQALQQQPDLSAARHNQLLVEQWIQQMNTESSTPANTLPNQTAEAPKTAEAQTHSSTPASSSHHPAANTTVPHLAPISLSGVEGQGLIIHPQGKNSLDTNANKPLRLENTEGQQALEQWLRRIPDNPGELLRRKFLYEQQRQTP